MPAVLLALAGHGFAQEKEPAARSLVPGVPIERRISPGESHVYEVPLRAGHVLDVRVERRGMEASVQLDAPGAPPGIPQGLMNDRSGVVRAIAIAGRTGNGRVTVRSREENPPGSYRIRLGAPRPARAGDRLAVEAEALLDGFVFYPNKSPDERSRSICALQDAIVLWRRARDERGAAEDLTFLGFEQFYDGRPKEALASHREALDLWRRLGDRSGEMGSANALGMTSSSMASFPEAIRHYSRAAALARAVGDPFIEARALSNMSIAYNAQGEHEAARECLERALPLRRLAQDVTGEAFTLSNLADVYSDFGDRQRTYELRSRAAQIAERFEMATLLAQILVDIGVFQLLRHDDAGGFASLQRARQIAKSRGFSRLEARAVSATGRAKFERGEAREAVALFREALVLHKSGRDRPGEVATLTRLGLAQAALGETGPALESFEASRQLARDIGGREAEATVLVGRARFERVIGHVREAREDVDRAIGIIESQRRKISRGESRATYLATRQDAFRLSTALYLDRHAESPAAGFDQAAFQETERSRARALVESVAESGLDFSSDVPPDLHEREDALSAKLSDLQKRRVGAPASEVSSIEEDIGRGEEEWRRLTVEIRGRSPRYASLRYPEPITAERARLLVEPGTAIVSYLLGDDSSSAFVLTAAGLAVEKVPATAKDLSVWTDNYVGLLSTGAAGFDELEARLSAALLAPWKGLPREIRRVIVVPDGPLNSLPFETLRLPGERERLIGRYSISYVASVTLLAALTERPRAASGAVLILAAPPAPATLSAAGANFDGQRLDLQPLPHAAEEARAILRLSGAGTKIWLGSEASERRLKASDLAPYGVLHFATHAFLSQSAPSRSALVLAAGKDDREDGLLQAREIYGLKLRSELVVLSACRTAAGRILPGEGVQGLAQAFFHAGTRSLVASLWDVSDARTSRFMEDFYRRLSAGERKSDALRGAKLDALGRQAGLPPRYWAPFILVGEGESSVFTPVRGAASR